MLYLIVLSLLVLEVSSTCPLLNPGFSCSCETHVDSTKTEFSIVSCSNLHSEAELLTVLRASRGLPVFELELVDCSLRYLPHDAFVGTTYEVLSIRNSSLLSLSDTNIAFEGLETKLHLLEVVNCSYIGDWDWSQLSRLRHLMEIHVSNSDLFDVTDGISSIAHIEIEAFAFQKNSIEHLEDTVFSNFLNLERLLLDNNKIQILKRSMIPKPAKKLKLLGLSYNSIEVLPLDMFVGMPALKSIYLTGNPLFTIDEGVFRPVWKQIHLFLFYATRLSCDCRLAWIANSDNSRKFMHAECEGPLNFKGRMLDTMKPHELYCY